MKRTIEEQAKRYASSEIESGGLCGLNGIDASKYQPFIDGANWLKSLLLEKLQVYKGAMILDGYEPEDSCIKFMNELIEEINGGKYSSWISVEKRLPEKDCYCFTKGKGMGLNVLFSQNGKFYSTIEGGYRISISGITHWMTIPA